MVKINDTTTFPNTAPALTDHFPGTDVSNTATDAAGETVTFTLQAVMDLFEANMTVPSSVSSAYRTSTILSSTSNGEGASLIGIEDSGGNFTATDVEAALAEIAGAQATLTGTETLTNKTLTSPVIAQINDANGNEAATFAATASAVNYPNFINSATGNNVEIAAAGGDTNVGITLTPKGTGNISLGNYTLDADATVGAGQDNYVLTYDNASGTWGPEPTGGGDVSISGTPADNQIAVWTGASAIEGDGSLTWNGSTLDITGDLVLTERADHAFTPVAGHGILWVSNDATQKLYFTNDAGVDNEVLTSGSGSVLADTVAASDDKFVFFDTSDSDNPKYSNDIAGDLGLALKTGDTYTGTHNFGGADDFEIPNGTGPVVDTDGQVAIDTSVTDFSHGIMKYFGGEEMAVVAMPIAQLTTPSDGHVVAYNATNDEFELVSNSGSGIAAVVDDTTPQLGGMLDVNGNAIGDGTRELLTFTEDGSAVNHVNIENQGTGGGPIISAVGDDTNVDLNLAAKGSGIVAIGSAEVATISATQTLTNKTIDSASNTLTLDMSEGTLTGTLAQFNTALSDGNFTGQQHLYIPAAAMIARTTSGAAAGSTELATNDVMVESFDFDTAADEHVQFSLQMPKNWNEGTLVAQFIWSHPSTTTNFGVTWAIQAVAFADGDAGDTAFGTAVLVDDTGGTTDDIYISPESGAITVAGTPGAEEYVVFQVYRDVSDANDTLAVDARLHGVKIHWTSDAITAD